jgi:type II secretory pathway pseudopilin PulG
MKLKLNKKIIENKGFTIIELMLVMLLIFIIISLVSSTYFLSANASKEVIDVTTSMADSRVVIYKLSKDLRETSQITGANIDNITFKSNVDNDIDEEEVNYYLTAEDSYYTLYRVVDAGSAEFVTSNIIDNNLFKYYSDINTPADGIVAPVSADELNNIKIIEINLSIDQSGAETQRTMELYTAITLRNKI